MEWLLTIIVATTFDTTPIPLIRIERLTGLRSLELCLNAGLYTRTALLQPDFRLPGESTLLTGQPVTREVIISCDRVNSA